MFDSMRKSLIIHISLNFISMTLVQMRLPKSVFSSPERHRRPSVSRSNALRSRLQRGPKQVLYPSQKVHWYTCSSRLSGQFVDGDLAGFGVERDSAVGNPRGAPTGSVEVRRAERGLALL